MVIATDCTCVVERLCGRTDTGGNLALSVSHRVLRTVQRPPHHHRLQPRLIRRLPWRWPAVSTQWRLRARESACGRVTRDARPAHELSGAASEVPGARGPNSPATPFSRS